ncbi:MAG: adenylyltransferase/cytidyltransferase family protein [Candidatus Aenigmarchaeota archaeon]|nr:adenylyltransferase/cytidyltransferase family protein [Candidatus Aenigmarchaeota archaeon]
MTRVLTGGTFNKIHKGHVELLKRAKKLGHLIVVIAHNNHNKKPYTIPAEKRKKIVEKLKIAEKVIIGDHDRFAGVIEREKPDVIVLGYDQNLPDKETKELVAKMGIKVIRLKKFSV